ncbi:class I SAM-dependent methyltransferase [Pinirhizobacter soli]|uniref:class I SAM-dependent methyltransferase n=1 Tax=Pinirhizobacter soli TaxID=2786953 RepID=UPI002029C088|nr:class I SAM-dependent methyltransferase [Pinirhizobacter soli]
MELAKVLETQRGIDGMLMEVSAAIWCTILEAQHESWSWSDGKACDYLEIGTFKGKAASILANFSAEYGNKVTVIDPVILPETRKVLLAINGGVQFIEGFSEDLYHSDFHRSNLRRLGFIHVDGMHTFSAILSDLKVSEEMLSPFGILSLDDFHTDLYPQIPAATYKYLSGPTDLSIFLVAFNKAYMCRNAAKPYFMRFVEDHLVYSLEALGHPTSIVKTDRNDGFDAYSIVPFQGERRVGAYFTKPA